MDISQLTERRSGIQISGPFVGDSVVNRGGQSLFGRVDQFLHLFWVGHLNLESAITRELTFLFARNLPKASVRMKSRSATVSAGFLDSQLRPVFRMRLKRARTRSRCIQSAGSVPTLTLSTSNINNISTSTR